MLTSVHYRHAPELNARNADTTEPPTRIPVMFRVIELKMLIRRGHLNLPLRFSELKYVIAKGMPRLKNKEYAERGCMIIHKHARMQTPARKRVSIRRAWLLAHYA